MSLQEHRVWLENAKRFRAMKYADDGAIRVSDLIVGRWVVPEDAHAWQLIVVDKFGMVAGVMWFLDDPSPNLRELHCYHPSTADALEAVRHRARAEGVGFVEMGGWAATSGRVNLLLLLLTVAFHRANGPSLASVVITKRRHATEMVKKFGGVSPGTEPYVDERFGCEMELLVLDSRTMPDAYAEPLADVMRAIPQIPVIAWGGA